MSFSLRAPSTAWEAVPLPTNPPVVIWAWFKPTAAPNSVVLKLPPDLWQSGIPTDQLTLRLFVGAAGVESLMGWTLFGQQVPLSVETMAWLEATLPPPPEGTDQQLILWAHPVAVPAPMISTPMMPQHVPALATDAAALPGSVSAFESAPVLPGGGDLLPGEDPIPYLQAIDFFWTNILYIESDIRRARNQLEQSIARVNSMNRDLSAEEMQASDSVDRQQWQDVRRWLRDAASALSRSTKEIDVGLLSGAGQRSKFLTIIEDYVKPQRVFPGIKQAVVDFEMHHKSAKNVLQAAQTAIHKGTSDGERRANTVLQRIQQKIRAKSNQARGKNA